MYIISKDFTFSASHRLNMLPKTHKCYNLHGHNYMVRVELCSHDLNEYGFVVDYGDLSVLKDHIDMVIDHKHIVQSVKDIPESMEYTNCFILGEPSTAENLARYFYEWCTAKKFPVKSVGVSETSKTWAYYTPTNYKPITAGTSVIKVSTISGDWEIIS